MGRWTQYDEDDYRLPGGMRRVGYDADTQRYYFRDRDGTLWEGVQGAQYSQMKRVEDAPAVVDEPEEDGDLEAASGRNDGYQPVANEDGILPQTVSGFLPHLPRLAPNSPWRTLFPFFGIVVVCLLLAWRLVFSSPVTPITVQCPGTSTAYHIKSGDTCWDIAQRNQISLDELLTANQGLPCEKLRVGQTVCLPEPTKTIGAGAANGKRRTSRI